MKIFQNHLDFSTKKVRLRRIVRLPWTKLLQSWNITTRLWAFSNKHLSKPVFGKYQFIKTEKYILIRWNIIRLYSFINGNVWASKVEKAYQIKPVHCRTRKYWLLRNLMKFFYESNKRKVLWVVGWIWGTAGIPSTLEDIIRGNFCTKKLKGIKDIDNQRLHYLKK